MSSMLWRPGQTLRIQFLDGDPWIQAKVRKFAEQWLKYANLHFRWVQNGPSDIRIGFTHPGSYSLLGTTAKRRSQSQTTMNFGWFDRQTSETEFRRTILHEFGHALGLGHEHKSPRLRIHWNEALVIADMKRQGWDEAKTRHNILSRLDSSSTRSSRFDPDSIMLYSIPDRWTLDGYTVQQKTRLSHMDKEFVGQLYPFSSPRPPIVDPTPIPGPRQEITLELTNTARPRRDGRTWDWTAFLRGRSLPYVDHVIYHLHPTFPKPDRRVNASAGVGFPMGTSGWGSFTLGATAYLKDGRRKELRHRLVFRQGLPGPKPIPPVIQRPQGPPRLALTNVARQILDAGSRENSWQWTAFLMGEDVDQVHHVVYLLHPTFHPRERRVEVSAGPGLPLTVRGWGTFTLRARVALNDGRVVRLEHPLQFR
jgi:transcription initiation factor IIF auxiliary subunit